MADDVSKPDEVDEPAQEAQRWIAELGASEKFQKKWLDRSRRIARRYEREGETTQARRRFSMLWSNTQTITPALYARPPVPVVTRRFKDEDPVAQAASEVLERALSFSIDKQDMDGVLRLCAQDYVLIARAQVWERYCPTHGPAVTSEVPVLQVTNDEGVQYEDSEGNSYAEAEDQGDGTFVAKGEFEPIVYEESVTDFLCWEDFGFGPARTWEEVPYVWRRVYMTRDELKSRFGEIGARVPLDWGDQNQDDAQKELTCKAAVYEVWDKRSQCAYWINRNFAESPLDKREDPLGLDGFFPCPRPLMGTLAPGKLNPVADFIYYQDQSDEIDELTTRIAELQKALKLRGFYAATEGEDLNNLLASNNNTLIPVQAWSQLTEDGGIKNKVEWFPVDVVVQALKACIELRQQLIADVYQITGVSDIQRGASDPRETYGAQQIKATFGSLRIRDRQNEMVRFARDILRVKAEVIAEHFGPQTLAAITGLKFPTGAEKMAAQAQAQQLALQAQQTGQPPQLPPQLEQVLASPSWDEIVALLRDNASRQFRIDVETDSTIEPNESEEKARTVEFINAIGSFFASIGPIVQQAPQAAPMFAEIVKSAVRKFRVGREVETAIERTMDQIAMGGGAGGQQPPPPEPPDKTPVEVASINLQREQVKQQGENNRAQLEAQVAQTDQALKAGDQQLKIAVATRDPNPQAAV